ncbi:hypothetical protein BJX64DRAFT_291156 [Aspergillus heterothallicus]
MTVISSWITAFHDPLVTVSLALVSAHGLTHMNLLGVLAFEPGGFKLIASARINLTLDLGAGGWATRVPNRNYVTFAHGGLPKETNLNGKAGTKSPDLGMGTETDFESGIELNSVTTERRGKRA